MYSLPPCLFTRRRRARFRTGSQSQDSTEFPTSEAAPTLLTPKTAFPMMLTSCQSQITSPHSFSASATSSATNKLNVIDIFMSYLLPGGCQVFSLRHIVKNYFKYLKISIEFTPMIWVPNLKPLTRRTEVKAIQPIKRRNIEGADDQDEVRRPEWHQ